MTSRDPMHDGSTCCMCQAAILWSGICARLFSALQLRHTRNLVGNGLISRLGKLLHAVGMPVWSTEAACLVQIAISYLQGTDDRIGGSLDD